MSKQGEKYQLPGKLKDGLYKTGNEVKKPDSLFLTADGRLWESQGVSAKRLLHNNVQPHLILDHGGFGQLPCWRIDDGGEDWKKVARARPHVNRCVYTAVNGFLKMMGLGSMTTGDQDWFCDHPNVNSDGASRGTVLGVVHGLVYPYSLGISRVFFPKLSALSGEHAEFAKALGMNPMAAQNHATSNDEFITFLGDQNGGSVDPLMVKSIMDTCRIEFVETPPVPCVIMTNTSSTTLKKKTGNVGGSWSSTSYGMGHADYVGPRDRVYGEWIIAMQFDRLEKITYQDPDFMSSHHNIDFTSKETLELSMWNSSIGGKKVSEYSPPPQKSVVVHHTTKTKHAKKSGGQPLVYPPSLASVPPTAVSAQDYFAGTGALGEVEIEDKCPMCDAKLLLCHGVGYCDFCAYWCEVDDPPSTLFKTCPMCLLSTMPDTPTYDSTCGNCGFTEDLWTESWLRVCGIHRAKVWWYTIGGSGKESIYVCPVCLREKQLELDDFITRKNIQGTINV